MMDDTVSPAPPMWEMETSPTVGAIGAALAKAQGMMTGATKGGTNPHFNRKYSELADVIDVIREPLSKNEIAFVQGTSRDFRSGEVIVTTQLIHSSGEWIKVRLPLRPVKDDPQGDGSAITYARRYSLMGITGVAPDDDDGNAASGNTNGAAKATPPKSNVVSGSEAEKQPTQNADVRPVRSTEEQQYEAKIRAGMEQLLWPTAKILNTLKARYKGKDRLNKLTLDELKDLWAHINEEADKAAQQKEVVS